MKKFVFLFLALFLAGCTVVPPGTECTSDSDCVKAECCHAASCVLKENAPDCSDVMCSMECVPGTLDCGGSCACIDGQCVGQNFYQA